MGAIAGRAERGLLGLPPHSWAGDRGLLQPGEEGAPLLSPLRAVPACPQALVGPRTETTGNRAEAGGPEAVPGLDGPGRPPPLCGKQAAQGSKCGQAAGMTRLSWKAQAVPGAAGERGVLGSGLASLGSGGQVVLDGLEGIRLRAQGDWQTQACQFNLAAHEAPRAWLGA